jgi:DNA-binding NtrC family response regulator
MRQQHSIPIRAAQKMELLAIRARSRDCLTLQSILIHTNWLVHWVADAHEAMLFLSDHPLPVLVCSEELPDGTWSDLLAATQELVSPPKVLVYSDQADHHLGSQVLGAGGYDLLSTPLQREEVLRAISLACRTWREEIRRQEVHAAVMTA